MTATISKSFVDRFFGFSLQGGANDEKLGTFIKLTDDFNGDGFADIVVGGIVQDPEDSVVVFGGGSRLGTTVDLSTLAAADGFRIDAGGAGNIRSGFGSGDVNGDGVADLILAGRANGEAHVLFGGGPNVYGALDLGFLNGADGFEVVDSGGPNGGSTNFGHSAANGDFNGDGFNDIVVGDFYGAGLTTSVIFGAAAAAASFDVAALDGADGFRVTSLDVNGAVGDFVGDFNGDGLDDLLIWEGGYSDPNAPGTQGTGVVVFGGQTLAASGTINDLDGPGVGVRLVSSTIRGYTAVGVGDVNGDGFSDIFISQYSDNSDGGGVVVFGGAQSGVTIDLGSMDGTDGFRVVAPVGGGEGIGTSFNNVAAAGDFNGDGVDDFIVGAHSHKDTNGVNVGAAYIVFGQSGGFAATVDLASMTFDQGFAVVGETAGALGFSVSGGADVNGDGFDDIAMGGFGVGDAGPGSAVTSVMYGGDFSGGVQVGDGGANIVTGGSGIDRIVGGLGVDTLDGGGGEDALSGGAGDDVLIIRDGNFRRVDGGTGADTLRLAGSSAITLDFTAIGHEGVHSIETIDLASGQANILRLRPVDVAGLSETTNKLFVTGGAGNRVELVGDALFPGQDDAQSFAFDGVETIGGVTFNRYVSGARIISVEQDVAVTRVVDIDGLIDQSVLFQDADGLLNGQDANGRVGSSGTLGADRDGDGRFDVVIGGVGPNVLFNGTVFVVRADELPIGPGVVDLEVESQLNLPDGLGGVVAAIGDINGDGFDDILDATPEYGSNTGNAFIEFGEAEDDAFNQFARFEELSASGRLGYDLSGGGDINGDGIVDFILGAPFSEAGGTQRGQAFVVFGPRSPGNNQDFSADGLDGADGFRIDGPADGIRLGQGVEMLGDVNGDGIDDLAVAAPFASYNGGNANGAAYVIFGRREGFDAVFDPTTLDGSDGFRVIGSTTFILNRLKNVRDAGDLNRDGVDDIHITGIDARQSYVIFGSNGSFAPSLNVDALDGADGFTITGTSALSGVGSAGVGDVNGDGVDDLLIDDNRFSSTEQSQVGRAIVLFGDKDGFGASVDVNALTDAEGYQIIGGDAGDLFGRSARDPGDVNGDGINDLLLGAPGGGVTAGAGESVLIFGDGDLFDGGDDSYDGDDVRNGNSFDNNIKGGAGDDLLRGGLGDDALLGGIGNDNLTGAGGEDVLLGGTGNDRLNGGADADYMLGQRGNDIYTVDNSNDIVRENVGEGTDRINTFANFVNPANVEILDGQFANQGLVLTGNFQRNQITGANKISTGDTINGEGGNDLIVGLVGNDTLLGGDGDDRIFGNSGNDDIAGGQGNDTMTGQQGIDTYRFELLSGVDRITDFAIGVDQLDVSIFFNEFAQVQAALADVNNTARLTFSAGNFVNLSGVQSAQLTEGDFIFDGG